MTRMGVPLVVHLAEHGGEVDAGDSQDWAGVVEHVTDPAGRITLVNRQVGAAGFKDGQDGDDHVRRAGQFDRDDRFQDPLPG